VTLHVVTASIPERSGLLAECCASVSNQTVRPRVHLIGVDHQRRGPATIRNELAAAVTDGWIAFVDDDDLWDPHHLETLLAHTDNVDVVYSLARIDGRPGWDPQQPGFDASRLRKVNYIPLSGLVRADVFHTAGGFPCDGRLYEDHGLWLSLLDVGAEFRCVPETTWTYRFGTWDSRSKEIWDGRRVDTSAASLA
jgi:hypothetical protein